MNEDFGINLRSINYLCEMKGGGVYKFLSTTSDTNNRSGKINQLIVAKDIRFVYLVGRYVKMTINRLHSDWHLDTNFHSAAAVRDLYVEVRNETIKDEEDEEEKVRLIYTHVLVN